MISAFPRSDGRGETQRGGLRSQHSVCQRRLSPSPAPGYRGRGKKLGGVNGKLLRNDKWVLFIDDEEDERVLKRNR